MEREGKERIHFTAYTSRCIPPRHRATCSVRRFLNAGKEKKFAVLHAVHAPPPSPASAERRAQVRTHLAL